MPSATITLPKTQYEILKKRASLYEEMLRFVPELRWGIEEYSDKSVVELMGADRLKLGVRTKLKKLLAR